MARLEESALLPSDLLATHSPAVGVAAVATVTPPAAGRVSVHYILITASSAPAAFVTGLLKGDGATLIPFYLPAALTPPIALNFPRGWELPLGDVFEARIPATATVSYSVSVFGKIVS